MLFKQSIASGLLTCAVACASATPRSEPPSAAPVSAPEASPTAPGDDAASPSPAATTSASAAPTPTAATPPPTAANTAIPPEPGVDWAAEQASFAARATGPATGGPRGTRACAFHESVDVYQRQCLAKVNADGSLSVTAKGTKLNPDNGFDFTMHGGTDSQWVAKGTLNAFGACSGPFAGLVTASLDKGVTVYEVRFKQHCMIVIR